MAKPSATSYPGYFQQYIDQVLENNLDDAFINQSTTITKFLAGINEEKSTFAYAENKWTIKEVLQHIIDSERIFCYRALAFARNDKTNLPGFDENEYALHSNANNRNWNDIKDEFILLRKSTEMLFNSFTQEALTETGVANNNATSVDSIGFIIIGHCYHHKKIIKERYF